MKALYLFFATVMMAAAVNAAPAAQYAGSFVVGASNSHKDGVKGAMQFMFDNGQFTQVQIKADLPVFGKVDFPSTEQDMKAVSNDTFFVVFKIKGAPHKWYYFFLAKSVDGKVFDGTFYKAAGANISEVEATFAKGLPPEWKVVGQGSVTKQ